MANSFEKDQAIAAFAKEFGMDLQDVGVGQGSQDNWQPHGRRDRIAASASRQGKPPPGYPEARDWTEGVAAPEDDGIFRVEVGTGTKKLIVSFARLRDAVRALDPAPCWNRTSDAILVPGIAKDGTRQMFLLELR